MNKLISLAIILSLSLLYVPASIAEDSVTSSTHHMEKGNKYLLEDRPFAAIEEYKNAIRKGASDPILFRNLAIVLYDLGFLDEATDYMQKALSLSPYANSFQMELGIIYLAKENYTKAKEQFMAVLERNPGFANAYYYLGETYYRTSNFDTAWLFSRMAEYLRHKGSGLKEKLKKAAPPPDVDLLKNTSDALFIRQILVDTRERAEKIAARISEGELFEDVASEIDKTLNSVGGFLGHFKKSELHPRIATALSKREAFSDPVIVETELGFHIVQRIIPFDFNDWKMMLARSRESVKSAGDKTLTSKDDEKNIFADSGASGQLVENENVTPANENELISGDAVQPGKKPRLRKKIPRNKGKKYLVFSGAFKEEKNAIERVEKFRKLGHPSYSYVNNSGKGPLHMVVVGKYNSLRLAQDAGKSIKELGFDYFIVE